MTSLFSTGNFLGGGFENFLEDFGDEKGGVIWSHHGFVRKCEQSSNVKLMSQMINFIQLITKS
jgi:hypothetical protein